MPSPEAPLLEVRGLVRRFGASTILDGIDLTVQRGEALLLLGPNGAGKSTLLRTLAGLARPERGSVRVAGASVAESRRRVGYLAHDTMLYDDLTVAENLRFAARLHGALSTTAIDRALERGDLTAQRDRLVRHLSRGQSQRAALARALMHGPDLLLLDEPFTGLDSASATRLTVYLRETVARGRAVILVGHHVEEGWEAVTRVAAIARGRWILETPRPGSAQEIASRYREALHG
jgi:heme exporter protein A